jgi:hypothetical protein
MAMAGTVVAMDAMILAITYDCGGRVVSLSCRIQPSFRSCEMRRLDPHQVTPDLEVHQRRQSQQECLVELAEPEGKPLGSCPLLYFRWRAVGQQTTFVDNEYPVGGLVRLLQVVRGEQQGPPLGDLGFHVGPEGLAALHVHCRRWLVQHDQVAFAHDRQREPDALRLAAGQPAAPPRSGMTSVISAFALTSA